MAEERNITTAGFLKTCSKCKQAYPPTIEFFKPRKRYKNGLGSWCRNCERQDNNRWVAKHREQHNADYRQWYSTVRGHLMAIYRALDGRCNNPKDRGYHNYGGRGIKNMFGSSIEFVDYVLENLRLDPRGLDVDRIENNGNYEPGNIRFVTRKINLANRRNTR